MRELTRLRFSSSKTPELRKHNRHTYHLAAEADDDISHRVLDVYKNGESVSR